MRKILLKESELINLIETAMDLDIYNQQSTIGPNNGNLDIEDTVDDIIDKLNELKYMLKSGKKIHSDLESRIYKAFDDINRTFLNIKYED
jgi:hypothetical protein